MNRKLDSNFIFVLKISFFTLMVGLSIGLLGGHYFQDYKILTGMIFGSLMGSLNFFFIYWNLVTNIGKDKPNFVAKVVGNYYIRLLVILLSLFFIYKMRIANPYALALGFVLYLVVLKTYYFIPLLFRKGDENE